MSTYTREIPGLPPINWKSVVCPICGATPGRRCDASASNGVRRTHLERQWKAIDEWWAQANVFWCRIPCPIKDCNAPAGTTCRNAADRPHTYRIKKAEQQ